MKRLTTGELRKAYLDFFITQDHRWVKSDSLVPAHDPSVLFTSAGMNQFKDYFLGKTKGLRRAVSCQKCFRTGDLEEVGRTPFHHTFFEMLGNFSFGDYFKKEAIEWAWEFVTKVLQIPENKLWVSVYEDDDEAFGIWQQDIGLAKEKIQKFGQKENFWPSNAIKDGPNGPCGPCSEIYFKKENGESVELWNLVFTQFDRRNNGVLEPLPSKNIDTGMGLERMSSVLQSVDSNFEIDIFKPIVSAVKKAAGVREEKVVNTIADHARAVTFCICDGVLPSNDGRGYVVRKLIRRCAYLVQAKEPKPFLYKIVSSVADAMADQYPEVEERRDNIAQIIKAEEEKYIKNIREGGERLKAIDQMKADGLTEVPSSFVAELYGTYGYPPEFTIEYAKKMGMTIDVKGADALIKSWSQESRAASKFGTNIFAQEAFELKNSRFVGYEMNSCKTKVLQIIKDGQEVKDITDPHAAYGVILEKTPFYAESGGQVGDRGKIHSGPAKLYVIDVVKQKDSIVHLVKGGEGAFNPALRIGEEVEAVVDGEHREAVKRAHTATHILQAVLRQVLGPHVQQAGSYVEPDRFRFDFTHFKDINDEEMEDVQKMLNEYVIKNDRVTAQVMSKDEAKKTGAIALFGEKYDDTVRVISAGDYSKEFCGGTHLDFTGKIGFILITSESSVGSGLRRIEALTGKLAFEKIEETIRSTQEMAQRLNTRPGQSLLALDQLISKQKVLEKENYALKEKELKFEIEEIARGVHKIKNISLVTHKFKNFDVNLLRKAVDFLKDKISSRGVFFLASIQESNAFFVCGITRDLIDLGLDAGDLVKKILGLVGGSGGGRKDFAQGGTKETGKVDAALKEFERLLKEALREG